MSNESLETAMKQHYEMRFQEFPNNDAFADWVASLAEYGGYVYGLATQVFSGIDINYVQLEMQHGEMTAQFNAIYSASFNLQDQAIHDACLVYMYCLDSLVREVLHCKSKL